MSTQPKDPYSKAHLVVAAIRILTHQETTPPSVQRVCQTLNFSVEEGLRLCRRLAERGIVEIMEGAYGNRLQVVDHLEIENLPREDTDDRLQEALEKFRSNRNQLDKKVETFKSQQEKKQKDLFAELNKKLKGQVGADGKEVTPTRDGVDFVRFLAP
jgi:diadenosine tetraphosphate (Ap4A) HIT family hydrolase